MKKTYAKTIAFVLTFIVVAVGPFLALAPRVSAATIYPYFPNNLIGESVFEDSGTMSPSAIQTFLNNENSGLKGQSFTESCSPAVPPTSSTHPYTYRYTYYPHCGKKESAATIIYDASKAYGINPRAIMSTMQKEESLITTPYSTSSAYKAAVNCAMGYTVGFASCADSPYQGFFSQVDNGTWQFRTDIELMSGRNWWGYAPSSYPCSTSTSLYNNGLYSGRTVKFTNPGGTAKTITIADAATAALYCYTPYVGPRNTTGPYQGTGYSGSFNFVQSFEQWWGSTVYTWAGDATVTTYSDSARTIPLDLSGNLASNKKIYVTASAVNTGSQTWTNSFTKVGTINPDNRTSVFHDSSWPETTRPAHLTEPSVAPEATGTFKFSLTTPGADGEYHEDFGLVAEGKNQGWMKDSATFGFDINVSNPYNGSVINSSIYNDSACTKTASSTLEYGQKVYLCIKAKNTGTSPWSNSFTKVATSPVNRHSVFQDSSWAEATRPAHLIESSVSHGQTGTFKFSLTAPSTTGSFNESFQLLAEGQDQGWMPGTIFTKTMKVGPPITDSLSNGQRLSPGQKIKSSNGKYYFVLQGDGNLVLYSSGRPMWATNSNGTSVSNLVMQGDGNLVLYRKNGSVLWTSNTDHHPHSRLLMQNDGNLVIYDASGKPIWATGTNG